MSEVILKVDHLKKYFPVKAKMFSGSKGTVHAVDDVSFEIRKGETFGLVGESRLRQKHPVQDNFKPGACRWGNHNIQWRRYHEPEGKENGKNPP